MICRRGVVLRKKSNPNNAIWSIRRRHFLKSSIKYIIVEMYIAIYRIIVLRPINHNAHIVNRRYISLCWYIYFYFGSIADQTWICTYYEPYLYRVLRSWGRLYIYYYTLIALCFGVDSTCYDFETLQRFRHYIGLYLFVFTITLVIIKRAHLLHCSFLRAVLR